MGEIKLKAGKIIFMLQKIDKESSQGCPSKTHQPFYNHLMTSLFKKTLIYLKCYDYEIDNLFIRLIKLCAQQNDDRVFTFGRDNLRDIFYDNGIILF